jgi:hypothetical protein
MTPEVPISDLAGGILLSKWLQKVGISRMTGLRLRKQGKLKTITRYGRIYVTAGRVMLNSSRMTGLNRARRHNVVQFTCRTRRTVARVGQTGGEAVAPMARLTQGLERA